MDERGDVGSLRDKGFQGIHGKHNSMQGKSSLRVTPTPTFIDFLGIFRVLSPWSGLYPLFWAFSPFCPNFSPFLRALAPGGLFWALSWGFQPFFSSLGSFGGVGVKWKVLWSEMSVVRWCPLLA